MPGVPRASPPQSRSLAETPTQITSLPAPAPALNQNDPRSFPLVIGAAGNPPHNLPPSEHNNKLKVGVMPAAVSPQYTDKGISQGHAQPHVHAGNSSNPHNGRVSLDELNPRGVLREGPAGGPRGENMEKEYSGQSAGDHHSSAHLSDDDINAFFQAVEEDDVEKINESLRLTPDLVHAFFDNTFALSFVNSEAVLDLLLAANANINSTNSLGESALFFLNENMIEPMLRRRADPNVVTHAGETVLSVAKNENREFLVKLLIEANADPEAGMNEAEPSPPSVTEPVKSHQRSDVSVKHTAGTHAAYAPSQQVQLHVSPMERKQPTPSAITADVRPGVANSNVVQCIYNKKHFVVPELFQVTWLIT